MRVSDNGQGIPAGPRGSAGLGLNNLRRRAEKLNGELQIESTDAGTTIEWRVPLGNS